jgi:hypothetical protein
MAPEQNQDTAKDDSSFVIIKGRFKSSPMSLYGLLLVIFNPYEDLESHNIIISTFSQLFDIEPHFPWDRYEETILELKWKGNYNSSMTASLMDQVKTAMADASQKKHLYESANNYDYDSVEIFLSDIIYRIIHDKSLILEIGIQEVSTEEYRSARDRRLKPAEQQPQKRGYNVEDGAVILPLQPILAPVKGKPLYEIRIGDKIVCKILASSDRENYYIDLLELRIEDRIKPVVCEVIDIKAASRADPIEILTLVAPGIYGRIVEDERQVKLRIYDPKTDGPVTKKGSIPLDFPKEAAAEPESPGKGLSQMTYIIMGLFAFILIIFIILMYISF